jgi:hypothetical protein
MADGRTAETLRPNYEARLAQTRAGPAHTDAAHHVFATATTGSPSGSTWSVLLGGENWPQLAAPLNKRRKVRPPAVARL